MTPPPPLPPPPPPPTAIAPTTTTTAAAAAAAVAEDALVVWPPVGANNGKLDVSGVSMAGAEACLVGVDTVSASSTTRSSAKGAIGGARHAPGAGRKPVTSEQDSSRPVQGQGEGEKPVVATANGFGVARAVPASEVDRVRPSQDGGNSHRVQTKSYRIDRAHSDGAPEARRASGEGLPTNNDSASFPLGGGGEGGEGGGGQRQSTEKEQARKAKSRRRATHPGDGAPRDLLGLTPAQLIERVKKVRAKWAPVGYRRMEDVFGGGKAFDGATLPRYFSSGGCILFGFRTGNSRTRLCQGWMPPPALVRWQGSLYFFGPPGSQQVRHMHAPW